MIFKARIACLSLIATVNDVSLHLNAKGTKEFLNLTPEGFGPQQPIARGAS
jgi:hypothetical protein